MQIAEKIKNVIDDALKELDITARDILLEHPTELSHGDYSTSVAMIAAKGAKQDPRKLAVQIVEHLAGKEDEDIERIEVAGPGFINFHLSKSFYKNTLNEILKEKDNFGKNESLVGKKIMVEYTDPNPFKAFHIGHLMSNTIGESISRIIAFSGAEVKRANYQGDVGPHVAMAVWALQEGRGSLDTPEGLGKAYAHGAKMYKEGKQEEIDAINRAIYKQDDKSINAIYEKGRIVSLDYFETLYKMLGTTFDYSFFESETAQNGSEIVKRHVGKVFEESDGAIVFKGEKYNNKLHTRVFINSQGFPTYEAKEIGLAYAKSDVFDFDTSITITGNEIDAYFEVVKTALGEIDKTLAQKIRHVSHGMMKLPSGKMSSRTGDVVTAEALINEVQKAVLEIETEREIKDKEKNAEIIAIAALKYMILRQATHKDIIYDLKRSLSFEGDSGPYLQYAYTRATSVLEKTNKKDIQEVYENRKETTLLEKHIYRFPEVVAEARERLEPHHVTTYATELAGAFNSFYAREKIIAGENEAYNLALTRAVQIILKNSLHLLGINAPKRM